MSSSDIGGATGRQLACRRGWRRPWCALLLVMTGLGSVADAATPASDAAQAPAAPAPISWMLLGIPPNSIPVEGEPSDGQFDLILKLVISHMPGREHKYVYANTGRIVAMLQEGFPACYVS